MIYPVRGVYQDKERGDPEDTLLNIKFETQKLTKQNEKLEKKQKNMFKKSNLYQKSQLAGTRIKLLN